jgi:uncharacterized repeat protein (TIGR03803 family)
MKSNNFWAAAGNALVAATIVLILTLALVSTSAGQGKFKNLHTFTFKEGHEPEAGLIFDATGNLYGTTEKGGTQSCGSVFKLSPNPNGSWSETVLYSFSGHLTADGCQPYAGLIFDKQGNLYGTTQRGAGGRCPVFGARRGCGTVFKLTPNPDGSWTHTVLHDFLNDPLWRSEHVLYAGLVLDAAGNLYGTTADHWEFYYGTVFKLTPNPDGSWTWSVIYTMASGSVAGLIFDAAGNLYGTTISNVFKLTPNPDGTWTPTVLHTFTGGADGGSPYAGLVFDSAGNLYGTTANGGTYGHGVVFQLTPKSDGTWTETVLHQFTGGKDGSNPYSTLSFNSDGNLYATASSGGVYGYGVVFKLGLGKDGTWRESVLHAFKSNPGAYPTAGVIFDSTGTLYGTTKGSLSRNSEGPWGSVFEIAP